MPCTPSGRIPEPRPDVRAKGMAMSQQTSTFNPFDPTGMIKAMRDSNMDAWSKVMIQLVNTEAFAQATGMMLDGWLTTSGPFRKAIESIMTRVLTGLNLPT